jgi:2-polyprenyl-3-methyl-5-hydroxy-6-metoxy-1,4-benzoquinol methylase
VLDLPCGQGDLAECLLPILCKLGFESVEVVLSDISKASIELAKKRLKPLVEQFKLLKLEFICASGIDRSLSGFDFIISCGGLLQREVVSSQEEALAFLNDFIKSLKPGGALFVCGLSESYISAHQMKKLGLQIDLIESSSRMSVQSCSDVTYENFYIVSKPKSPLVALSLLRQEQQESLNENRDINQPGVTNS